MTLPEHKRNYLLHKSRVRKSSDRAVDCCYSFHHRVGDGESGDHLDGDDEGHLVIGNYLVLVNHCRSAMRKNGKKIIMQCR